MIATPFASANLTSDDTARRTTYGTSRSHAYGTAVSERLPRPKKRLGQHFLTDSRLLARIADALGATPSDTVLEIGPGRGALTTHLLQRAGKVIAIELDRELAPMLAEKLKDEPRFQMVEGDVLDQDLGALAGEGHDRAKLIEADHAGLRSVLRRSRRTWW